MQQLCRRTPMSKCDCSKDANFIEIALWHGCSLVNLLHIFRTPLPKSTSGWLLLILTLCIQNPAKHLRWSLLRKWLIVFTCLTGLGNYMFKVRNENIRFNPLSADPGKWSTHSNNSSTIWTLENLHPFFLSAEKLYVLIRRNGVIAI